MATITPFPYQHTGVNSLIRLMSQGYRKLVFTLPTRGGKTVCVCYFLSRYFKAYPNARIKICVHRERLAQQMKKTLKVFGITNVEVFMVESFINKLKSGHYLNTDLIICDEVHIGNFKKIHPYLPDVIFIGLTATPIAATKKHPLKADFEQIVVCSTVRELINIHAENANMGLVPGRHYCPENLVIKKDIKKSGGEFNMRSMSDQLSKSKLVDGVLNAYATIGEHKKTVIFNSLIDHSLKVNDCFVSHGYNSRHLDGKMSKEEQKDIFDWFAVTPNAILQSVDMATTGFDEPTIINVIPNRLTMSLPLWLQMSGRGGTPFPGKEYFNIIDPVGNIEMHGRWDFNHDWYSMFHHPAKSGKGVAPMKICINPLCKCMIYMSATICEYCGQLYPRKTVYTDMVIELKLVPDDLVIPKNSPITLDRTIKNIASKIIDKPIELDERRGVMEFAIRKLSQQSDLRISDNMALHLASKHV